MRRLELRTLWGELDDYGHWSSNSAVFAKSLNALTAIELNRIRPADGDRLKVLFNRMAEDVDATKVIYTEPETNEPGRVY